MYYVCHDSRMFPLKCTNLFQPFLVCLIALGYCRCLLCFNPELTGNLVSTHASLFLGHCTSSRNAHKHRCQCGGPNSPNKSSCNQSEPAEPPASATQSATMAPNSVERGSVGTFFPFISLELHSLIMKQRKCDQGTRKLILRTNTIQKLKLQELMSRL